MSPIFRFKRRPVYALPTWLGMVLFFFIASGLVFSILLRAPLEQWLSFLMVLFTLLHLLDANDPFRDISVEVPSFDPPFAGVDQKISVLIHNPGKLPSAPLYIRFQDEKIWTRVPGLAPQSSKNLNLPIVFAKKGLQELPLIRLRMEPISGLFRLWKVFESETEFAVLPVPRSFGYPIENEFKSAGNSDIDSLELIRDARLMHLKDQKLFLKTGKPFLRTEDSTDLQGERYLHWDQMHDLATEQKTEQFSDWLRIIDHEIAAGTYFLKVETPFYRGEAATSVSLISNLKMRFAEWVNLHA